MVFVETSFPRGGIEKPTVDSSQPQTEIEFGASTFKKRKEKLNKRQRDDKHIQENEDKDEKIEAISAELLSIKTITEGMIIMGCIQKIESTHLFVSLPGHLSGQVLVTAISKSYVDIVNRYVHDADSVDGYKTLDDMFRIGQIVCVKVMEISQSTHPGQTKVTIVLSMDPADIQCDFKHNRIEKDSIICVSVEDIADHGYIINTGIKNLRGFLPTANVTTDELGVGEVLFCKVEKNTKAQAASTVICKMIDISERKVVATNDANMSYILPSEIVAFKVTKVLSDGIQGTIMKDAFTGYVNEHQLSSPTASPQDYEVDDMLEARVLYVMPLTKLVYLSLNLVDDFGITDDNKLRVGTIVEQARVSKIGTGGLVMRLDGISKGLVSFKSLRIGYNKNFDSDELMAKYHKNSVHRVRITAYDAMDSLFICTNCEEIINEKYYTLDDIEVTDYVDATIINQLEDGGYLVRVGRIRGYLEKIQISSTTSASRLVPDAKIRCRVIRKNAKSNKIFLTNRKEYMDEESLLLRSYAKAVVGIDYHGMISKILPYGFIVSFCNYVTGFLYKRNLSESDALSTTYFYEGQITKFRVMYVRDNEHITLGLESFVSQIGTVLQAKISTVSPSGLNITFTNNSQMAGFVPIMFLSSFPSLVPLLHETYKPNASIDVVCVGQNVYSIRDMARMQTKPVKEWEDIAVGDVLPAFVKDVNGQVIDLHSFIANYTKTIKCHAKMLLEDNDKVSKIDLVAEQLLFIRILGKNNILKSLTCSAKLSHVWNGDLKESAIQFRQYLKDLQRIQEHSLRMKNPIASLTIGDRIEGKVLKTEDNQIYVKLPNSVQGVVSAKSMPATPLAASTKLDCLVIWIDYGRNLVHLAAAKKLLDRYTINSENGKKTSKFLLKARRGLKADVILVQDDVIVTYPRKATGKFVFIPTRLHFNDLQPVVLNDVHEGAIANITALESDGDTVIGMFESIVSMMDKAKAALKQKRISDRENGFVADVQEVDDQEGLLMEKDTDSSADEDGLYFMDTTGTSFAGESAASEPSVTKKSNKRKAVSAEPISKVSKKRKSKQQKNKIEEQLDGAADCCVTDSDDDEFVPNKSSKSQSKPTNQLIAGRYKKRMKLDNPKLLSKLPGAGQFWSATKAKVELAAASSSDEDAEASGSTQGTAKKTTLSTADRFRIARTEETRVRRIEETYANENSEATTVDQFERQVMASPNSSLVWINYMVFHMQSSEIHKARLVARRAIKKISFRESEELLNVWVALLNLELRYGDPEQFDATLVESMQTNDQFKIYVKCLTMLADVKKIDTLTEIIMKFTQKYKAQSECWSSAAAAYFEVGLGEKAQQLLNRALKSLPERDHVSTIVKFSVLNNKFGHRDTAHALMEQILTSYPKRVDCWSQYIDMLIKDKEIATARQILDRAVSQRIPMKKMRTVFKKYLDFEERFGDESSVLKVKGLASTYIEKELKA